MATRKPTNKVVEIFGGSTGIFVGSPGSRRRLTGCLCFSHALNSLPVTIAATTTNFLPETLGTSSIVNSDKILVGK